MIILLGWEEASRTRRIGTGNIVGFARESVLKERGIMANDSPSRRETRSKLDFEAPKDVSGAEPNNATRAHVEQPTYKIHTII